MTSLSADYIARLLAATKHSNEFAASPHSLRKASGFPLSRYVWGSASAAQPHNSKNRVRKGRAFPQGVRRSRQANLPQKQELVRLCHRLRRVF